MNDQIENLWSILSGDAGWLAALLTWIGVARFLLKVVNSWIESFFTGLLNSFPEDSNVRGWALGITNSFGYKMTHYICNWILSLSLPKFENLNKNETPQ